MDVLSGKINEMHQSAINTTEVFWAYIADLMLSLDTSIENIDNIESANQVRDSSLTALDTDLNSALATVEGIITFSFLSFHYFMEILFWCHCFDFKSGTKFYNLNLLLFEIELNIFLLL